MTTLSRREVTAAVAAAPLIRAAPKDRALSSRFGPDPVVDEVRTWIATKERQDALVGQWQDLENRLCERIRSKGITLTEGCRSGLPEARQMRAIMHQIRLTDRKLDRDACRLILLRAKSPDGALAKIEMALRIQQPQDCEEYVWALLQSGFEELSDILRAHGALNPA